MKKYFQGLGKLRFGVIVFIGLLSLFISWWTLRLPVNNKIRSLLPEYVCTLKVLEESNSQAVPSSEVWIQGLILGNTDGIFENEDKIIQNNGFELRKAADFGYSCDILVNTRGAGSEISFKWGGGNDDSITFWKQNLSGIISVNITFGEETILQDEIDLFSNQPLDTFVYTLNTPLNETVTPAKYIAAKWGVYFLGGAVLFLIVSAVIVRIVVSGDKDNQ